MRGKTGVMLAITDGTDKSTEQYEDDGIDWHDFVVVQTVDLEQLDLDMHSMNLTKENQSTDKIASISKQIQSALEFEKEQQKAIETQNKTEILTDAPLEAEMKIKKNYVKPSLVDQEKIEAKKADE